MKDGELGHALRDVAAGQQTIDVFVVVSPSKGATVFVGLTGMHAQLSTDMVLVGATFFLKFPPAAVGISLDLTYQATPGLQLAVNGALSVDITGGSSVDLIATSTEQQWNNPYELSAQLDVFFPSPLESA
jgi:hypothetical protein